jgi:hypothetical protein
MNEQTYSQYIALFNEACVSGNFEQVFDTYYEPDAVFEYVPMARKNEGRAYALEFWALVHSLMLEHIRPHTHFF